MHHKPISWRQLQRLTNGKGGGNEADAELICAQIMDEFEAAYQADKAAAAAADG